MRDTVRREVPAGRSRLAVLMQSAYNFVGLDQTSAGTRMFDRITFNPHIMGGRACIRGMRIPVSVIVSQVANGATVEEVLDDYPDLEGEDIQEALRYAAWLTQEQVIAS